jgi:hypothetical protein
VDTSAATGYYENIAPDPADASREYRGSSQDPEFSFGPTPKKAQRPRKGQEPAGVIFSHRDLSRRTGYPYVNFVTD